MRPADPTRFLMLGSRIRQLASETAVYGVSSVFGRLINFALVPFYTNVLPVDHYGVVILVYTAFVFLNILYTYGMESSYLRYASGKEGRANIKPAFSSAIWSLMATAILISLLLLVFRKQTAWLIGIQENWLDLLYFAVLIMTLDALAVIPLAELRLANRPWRFATARLLQIAINVALNLYLILVAHLGVRAIFIANLAASGSVLLFLVPEFVKYLRFSFDTDLWKSLVQFGMPFVPGGLAYALSERVSLFFLGKMTKAQVLGLYGGSLDTASLAKQAQGAADAVRASLGNLPPDQLVHQLALAENQVYGQYVVSVFGTAYKLAIFMMLISQMFRYAWQPFFLNRAEDPDAKDLFSRIFTLFTAVGLFVFLAISFFSSELVAIPLPGGRYLIPQAYWLGLGIVPIALLAYVFQGWYYNFSVGIYLHKKTRYLIHSTVAGGVVSLILTAVLVPRIGMLGAALATLASFATMSLTLLFFSHREYPITYEWRRIGGLALAAGVPFVAWSLIPGLEVWWAELILLAVFAIGLRLVVGKDGAAGTFVEAVLPDGDTPPDPV